MQSLLSVDSCASWWEGLLPRLGNCSWLSPPSHLHVHCAADKCKRSDLDTYSMNPCKPHTPGMQLEVRDGVLWHQFQSEEGTTKRLQLIVPREFLKEVLEELIAGSIGGHLRQRKTLSRLKERFYWPEH